jgi:hypothetical protein
MNMQELSIRPFPLAKPVLRRRLLNVETLDHGSGGWIAGAGTGTLVEWACAADAETFLADRVVAGWVAWPWLIWLAGRIGKT